MLDPVSAIQNITAVAKVIYERVKLVQANQSQCKLLGERVQIIEEAIRGLEKITNKSNYEKGLNDLVEILGNCLEFIEQFTEKKPWYAKILKAGTYQAEFNDFTEKLQGAMQQLNLGLAVQQLVNVNRDKEAENADRQFLQDNQQKIMQLNKEMLIAVQKLSVEQHDGHKILSDQMASIKDTLDKQFKNQPTKRLIEKHFVVPYYEIVFEKIIGEGANAEVHLGRWGQQRVAIKRATLFGERDKAEFVREIKLMSRLSSKSVVQFYGACLETNRECLLMEHMEKGSLYKVLEGGKLAEERQVKLALEIARGLHYLHSQGVVHCDLKSANVLVNDNWEAKLSDFGLSKTKTSSIMAIDKQSQALAWQAPECFSGTYTKQSDIYSYGVILWELATGKRPFAGLTDSEVQQRVTQGQFEAIPGYVPEAYASIIKACCQLDLSKRPSLDEVIRKLEEFKPTPSSAISNPESIYQQGVELQRQQNLLGAREAYEEAEKLGYFKANTNLGLFFLHGQAGVPQNKVYAYQHFLKAGNKGHARAMICLGIMLEHGDGVTQDLNEALNWYERAVVADPKDEKTKEKCAKLRTMVTPSADYPGFASAARDVLQ